VSIARKHLENWYVSQGRPLSNKVKNLVRNHRNIRNPQGLQLQHYTEKKRNEHNLEQWDIQIKVGSISSKNYMEVRSKLYGLAHRQIDKQINQRNVNPLEKVTRGQNNLTTVRIVVRTNHANVYNEKTFYRVSKLSKLLDWRMTRALALWRHRYFCLHAASCEIRLFRLLFRINANVYL